MANVQHQNLTGADAIHPAAYVSSTDPGAVGAQKFWVDTTTGPPYVLKKRNAANTAWETVGGGGSVTSVAMTVPTEFSVAGSPVTTTGTLAVTKANQNANLVYAGPASGAAAAPTFRALTPADVAIPYVNIQHQTTDGTAAGGFTSGAWQTRTLNTEVTDTGSIATLASNQITLPAGTYEAEFSVTAYNVNDHQARLQDVTNTTTLIQGMSSRASAAGNIQSAAYGAGRFTLAGTAAIELQHRCETSNGTDGFGRATNFTSDGVEVYAIVQLRKVA